MNKILMPKLSDMMEEGLGQRSRWSATPTSRWAKRLPPLLSL
jgi:hypothetical protein